MALDPVLPEPSLTSAHVLLNLAFDRGLSVWVIIAPSKLEPGHGFPSEILGNFPKGIPLHLEDFVFAAMKAVFTPESATLTLSFDKLYRCTFPWSAVMGVSFTLADTEREPDLKAEDLKTEVSSKDPEKTGGVGKAEKAEKPSRKTPSFLRVIK